MKKKRKNFYLPEEQTEALKQLKEATGLPMSEHVRRAINRYLVDYEVALSLKRWESNGQTPQAETRD